MAICTLESILAHVDELKKRVADTTAELSSVKSPTDSRAKKTKIDKLSKRIGQIELRLRLAKKEEAKALRALDKLSARQAVAKTKIGTSHISTSDFASLTPEDRLTHTEIRIEGSADATHQLNSLKRLHRFTPDKKTSHPISSEVSTTSPTSLARSIDKVLDSNGIEMTRTPEGELLLTDLRSGASIRATNLTHAALLADRLILRRHVSGSAHPPGAPGISLPGPNMPRTAPEGRLRSDGSRVDLTDGERHNINPSLPENRAASIPLFNTIKGLWHQFMSKTDSFLSEIDRHVRSETGEGWSFYPKWTKLLGKLDESHFAINTFSNKLVSLATKHKISWDRPTGVKIARVMRAIDDDFELIRDGAIKSKADPVLAQEKMESAIFSSARKNFPEISENEWAFLRDRKDLLAEIFDFLGLDPTTRRLGYFTRGGKALEYFTTDMDILNIDPTLGNFFGSKERFRTVAQRDIDPLSKSLQDLDAQSINNILTNGNLFESDLMYIRDGIQRKVAGDYIQDLLSEVKLPTQAEMREGAAALVGNVEVNKWLLDRVRSELEKSIGRPSPSDRAASSRRRSALINRAKTLKSLADHLESNPMTKMLVPALRHSYERIGLRATNKQISGLADTYTRLSRGKVFGFNLASATRDMVTTDTLLGIRFPVKQFFPIWLSLRTNPRAIWTEYLHQRDLGQVRDITEVISAPELARMSEANPSLSNLLESLKQGRIPEGAALRLVDATQILYKMSEIGQHLLINKVSEEATKSAWKKFRSSPDTPRRYDQFLIDTGVVYSTNAWAQTIRESLDSGHLPRLISDVQRINRIETNTLFNRYNSAPYLEWAPARAFMQFGSWPLGLLSSMHHSLTGPARNLSDPALIRSAYTGMATKWAASASAIYSLGAQLNIDTSDWIPSAHNAAFFGGPIVTFGGDVRELFGGDPAMMQKWEKNPEAVLYGIARGLFPIVPTTLSRAIGQRYGREAPPWVPESLEEAWTHFLSPPPQMDSFYDRTLVSLGAHPFSRPLYPSFRRGGLLSLGMESTVGAVMDHLSALSGGTLAPGTREGAADFKPLVAPTP